MMCMAAAYPSWVTVQGTLANFTLGLPSVLNHRDTPSHCLLLVSAGHILVNSVALCCLLAILSSCRALLLNFLGLKQGRTATFRLHSSAALFAARTAATSSSLWALRRHNLHTAQQLKPLGLSSAVGSSFLVCILACALAAIATGWSCTALAQVEPAVAICLARIKLQETNPSPTDEQDGISDAHGFPSSLQGEAGLPKGTCASFLQGGAEPQREKYLPYKQEAAEPQAEEGVDFIHKESDLQIEEGLSLKQADTSSNIKSLLIIQKMADSKMEEEFSYETGKTT